MFSLPLVILAGLSSPVTAQVEHPNRATGSRSETLYSSSGSDDVNLFNGGLTWRIPIGERVSVGPLLSIAPTLVYNSRTTRPWRTCRDVLTDHNVGDRAVGSGWQLHFGRLVPVHDRPPYSRFECATAAETSSAVTSPVFGMRSTRWGYQAPDGAVHEFYDRRTELTCGIGEPGCEPSPPPNCFSPERPAGHCFVYTHDGSFLRLDPRDPERGGLPTVYFPDGTWQVLGFTAGRRPAEGGSSALTDLDFADQHPDGLAAHRGDPPVSHATLIGDRFGNRITVQYYGDGTPGSPPHPLEAQGVAANQRDAIPYRAFPSASASPWEPLSPSKVYRFDVETVSYQPDPRNPPVVAPRLTAIVVPTSVPDGAGGWRTATWALEHAYWPTPSDGPRLETLHLPTLQGQDALSYSFTYGALARLAEVRLPSLGRVRYTYGEIRLWTRQRDFHQCPSPFENCYGFHPDDVTGVVERTQVRDVRRTTDGGSTAEESVTTYVRSYVAENVCSNTRLEACRLRVDVWSPRGSSSELYRVSRSLFAESDQTTNTALYGRPLETHDYHVAAPGPDRWVVDSATPYRSTTYAYDFDGPRSPSNPLVGTGAGTNHNTREVERVTSWAGRTTRTRHEAWDGSGHWGRTIEFEDSGSGEVEVRRVEKTHLNSVSDSSTASRWILDPETSVTVSRPLNALDPSHANVSTTETFFYDSAGFRTQQEIVSVDLGHTRTLRRNWTRGTSSTGPCLADGSTSPECSNLGFPRTQTETLTGSLDGQPTSTTYKRWFYYRNGVLSAIRDAVGFYAVDRDVSPTGQPVGERGPEGRTSLFDASPALTTTIAYDLLGRPITVQPPEEGPETTAYGRQTLLRVRRDGSGAEVSRRETFFDQLGRLTVERTRLPGGAWSCRITTLDAAGRRVGRTEWWKSGDPGIGNGCDDPVDLQATIGDGPYPASIPPGTTWAAFDALDRPGQTRLADGSRVEDTYAGYWEQETVRTVNAATESRTRVRRNSLGQVVAVREPAASKADGTVMNPMEETLYRYDHADRLISVRKPGSDANGGSPVTQVRTRVYDDFGWLVLQTDPEQPLQHVNARDARGNPLRFSDGQSSFVRTYDPAGRPLDARRAGEAPPYDWNGQPATWYEVFAYDSLPGFDFGRSNGRPVWSIRANHAVSNAGTVDFGWFGVTSFFHYNGRGGRLGFRQQSELLMPEPALPGPQLGSSSESSRKPGLADALRRYYATQGRTAKSTKDLMRAAASETVSRAAALGNPSFPEGPARWSYSWDSAGRLASITYPRRDEGHATTVTYGYDSGLLTTVDAVFRDPFASGVVGSVSAFLSYDPAGSVRETSVSTSALGGEALRLVTERDASGIPRPASWAFHRRSDVGSLLHESRLYSFDPSGNVSAISSTLGFHASYLYDARGRLVSDSIAGRTYNPESREYDGFGNLVRILGSVSTPLPTSRSTNRLSSSLATYDVAGRLTDDVSRNIGRDYYPDGALTTEYSHTPGGTSSPYPTGGSVWLVDGRAENALSYWSDGLFCQNHHFRSLLRDESTRLLTEYRGEAENPSCTCESGCTFRDRFFLDTVRLGPWAVASYTRGTGIRLEARDHLRSPRFVTDASGNIASFVLLDSFGRPLAGSPSTRETFTGHERNHVSGDGNILPLSDYMHARTYVPMWGRFTRPDPIDSFSLLDPQSFNRYAYARNNPLRFVDPDGRAEVEAGRVIMLPVNVVFSNASPGLRRSFENQLSVSRNFFARAGIGLSVRRFEGSIDMRALGRIDGPVQTKAGTSSLKELVQTNKGHNVVVSGDVGITGFTSGTSSIIGTMSNANTYNDELGHALGNVSRLGNTVADVKLDAQETIFDIKLPLFGEVGLAQEGLFRSTALQNGGCLASEPGCRLERRTEDGK